MIKKYILFKPENYIAKEEPDDTVLWKVKYNVKGEDTNLPIEIMYFNNDMFIFDAIPLNYLEENLNQLGMIKTYDFPFVKEYSFSANSEYELIATLIAQDMGVHNNYIKIPKTTSEKILKDMKLPFEGNMHPEKFHKKLIENIDLSDSKYSKNKKYFDYMVDLENLSLRCLEYEKNIEWNITSEVLK